MLLGELRGSINALSQLSPNDPLYTAHLTLTLTAIVRRLDELELRADVLAWEREPPS
jgi:hypothetical protein